MPWHGLFSQLLLADRILIYDDVQLPHGGGASRGFMTRVQIKTPNGLEWLSIPVQRSGQGNQKICDALVAKTDWRRQHTCRIEQAYRHAPFFKRVFDEIVLPIYENASDSLADFLVGSMEGIGRILGIPTPFERSSNGKWANHLASIERLAEICRLCGVANYVSGNGGMKYIDHDTFEEIGVKVYYLSYNLRPYPQLHGEFTPYVSFIDLLFNVSIDEIHQHLQTFPVYWRDWSAQTSV